MDSTGQLFSGKRERCKVIRREVRRVFQEEEDKAWAARDSEYTMQGNLFALLQAEKESITWKPYILCKETSLLYCRLRMETSHGSPTCGTFLVLS
jgi:hypothetical protein